MTLKSRLGVTAPAPLDRSYTTYRVTMPSKIFVGNVCCLAMPPNECVCALYERFRPLPPSCLLAQCDSSCMLHFRIAVRSHCWVIFFKNFVLFQLVFLYNVSIVIWHLFSLTSNSVIICRILRPRVIWGHSALANDHPRISGT